MKTSILLAVALCLAACSDPEWDKYAASMKANGYENVCASTSISVQPGITMNGQMTMTFGEECSRRVWICAAEKCGPKLVFVREAKK